MIDVADGESAGALKALKTPFILLRSTKQPRGGPASSDEGQGQLASKDMESKIENAIAYKSNTFYARCRCEVGDQHKLCFIGEGRSFSDLMRVAKRDAPACSHHSCKRRFSGFGMSSTMWTLPPSLVWYLLKNIFY